MSELVHLRDGMVAPLAAYNLVLHLERSGIRLTVDGPDVVVHGTVSPAALDQLRRWKPHVVMLLQYVPDDRHLYDKPRPRPPVLTGRSA